MSQLEITLKRSAIGQQKKMRETLKTLGLSKVGQKVVRPDSPALRGGINAVSHLVEVKEVGE